MMPDELPLWETPVLGAQNHMPDDVQTTISARIESLLGYTPTNTLFIRFINEFGHPNQLKCANSSSISHTKRRAIITKIIDFESRFNDLFYRAACIVMREQKRKKPELIGFNISEVLKAANIKIEEARREQPSAREDIGYTR